MTRKRPRKAVPAKRPKRPPAPSVPPPVVTSAMGAVRLLQELIAEDIACVRSGRDRHGKKLTPTAHRLLQATAMKNITGLAKLTGEADAMSDSKIVKLPGFRRIVEDIVRALGPWPDAMAAVAAELERIERGGSPSAEETAA